MTLTWLISGWSLVAIGAALCARALLWDRPRGRRRCPKCWYDMSGIAQAPVKCPECGRVAKNEKALLRTRRRLRWLLAGLAAAFLGTQAIQQPARKLEGWTRYVPTTALALGVRASRHERFEWVAIVLKERWTGAWRWQKAAALGLDALVTDGQVRQAIQVRPRWPAGMPILVHLSPWGSLDGVLSSREVTLSCAGAPKQASAYMVEQGEWICGNGYDPSREYTLLPALDAGPHTLHMNVAIRCTRYDGPGDQVITTRERSLDVPVEIVPEMAQAIEGARSPQLDALVTKCLSVRLLPPQGRPSPICLDMWNSHLPPDTALGVQVEVLHDSKLVGTTNFEPQLERGESVLCQMDEKSTAQLMAALPANTWSGPTAGAALNGWTLRIRGNARNSLTMFDKPKFWDGEVEVALGDILR